jgi:hypothetical protein
VAHSAVVAHQDLAALGKAGANDPEVTFSWSHQKPMTTVRPVDMKAIRTHTAAWSDDCLCEPKAVETCDGCEPLPKAATLGLVELVDAQTQALLRVEWSGRRWEVGAYGAACPCCGSMKDREPHASYQETFTRTVWKKHQPVGVETIPFLTPIQACLLDAALTAAGLPDQASRDNARRQPVMP